jgi:hypothetical protein
VNFYAVGYVVVADGLGYVGRAKATVDPLVPNTAFTFQYQNEDKLACPILPWPATLPTASTDPFLGCSTDTDAGKACRATCESLVLARKARRTYHLDDACDQPNDDRCVALWPPDIYHFPRATGPVIQFTLGVRRRDLANPGTAPVIGVPPVRGLELDLNTVNAVTPTYRRAPAGTGDVVFPTGGITPFDRSPYVPTDSYRFYVTFGGDFVLDFSPALSQNTGNVLH